jgi:hypothetical protein
LLQTALQHLDEFKHHIRRCPGRIIQHPACHGMTEQQQ